MSFKSSFFLASRFLKQNNSNPSNAYKSMIGASICVALSIVPLLVVLIVSDGMIKGITDRLIALSSYDLQVSLVSRNYDDYKMISSIIDDIPHVKSTVVERQGMALASGKKNRTGALVRGIDADIMEKNESFKKYINVVDGNFNLEKRSAVIGEKLAETLNLKVGDTVRIISSDSTSEKIRPRFASFKVSGIVSSGYQEMDAMWFFISVEESFRLFSTASSRIYVGVESDCTFDYALYELKKDIAFEICKNTDFYPSVYTWKDVNASQFENFASTKLLLVLIMTIIVLVSSVNVSSSVYMLVMEKRKEIAILKSFGTSNSTIVFVFLLIAFAIGLFGCVIGVPVGLLCAVNANSLIHGIEKIVNFFYLLFLNIAGKGESFSSISILNPEYYLQEIPISISFWQVFWVVFFVLLVSVLVSLVPSIRSGKEKPTELFRKV